MQRLPVNKIQETEKAANKLVNQLNGLLTRGGKPVLAAANKPTTREIKKVRRFTSIASGYWTAAA